ncbi:MAG: hypothetical protein R6U11_09955 [Bacteroidales bacterium]
MNYFQILGIGFGLVAFLKPVYMHVLPWDENKFIAKAYSKKRPAWILVAAIIGLLLVGFTWYMELTTEIKYSIYISILFSLTALKAIVFILDYQRFQKWVAGMLNKNNGKKIVVVDIFAGLFGLLVILVSLFLL